MKKTLLLLIALTVPLIIFSQNDFRRGFIVTNQKDTVHGLVNYREGIKSYQSCDFKEAGKPNTLSYMPGGILGYGYANDKYFESRNIETDSNNTKLVFLEVIVKGSVSLYKFQNTFFIEKENSGFYKLTNETEEKIVDGAKYLKQSNKYLGILQMLLYDCTEISSKAGKSELNERSLTSLVVEYNKCKNAPFETYKMSKSWLKIIPGIIVGINDSKLGFTAKPSTNEHLIGKFERSFSPELGFSVDILSPRINERISFHAEALYFRSAYHFFNITENNYTINRNYVTINIQDLKIPVGFRYTFPERSFTPYFTFGVSNTIHIKSGSVWIQEAETKNVVYTVDRTYNVINTSDQQALKMKVNEVGFWAGAGVMKSITSKISCFIDLRYEHTDGIVDRISGNLTDLKSQITNFQITCGLRTK
jgi:hypothetical protein